MEVRRALSDAGSDVYVTTAVAGADDTSLAVPVAWPDRFLPGPNPVAAA